MVLIAPRNRNFRERECNSPWEGGSTPPLALLAKITRLSATTSDPRQPTTHTHTLRTEGWEVVTAIPRLVDLLGESEATSIILGALMVVVIVFQEVSMCREVCNLVV
jgi:hypothetical protein